MKSKLFKLLPALGLVLILVSALSMSASADVFQTRSSTLSGGLGTFSLDATVYRNLVGSNYEYTYEYVLTFVTYGTGVPSEEFRVGNPSKTQFFGAYNTGIDFRNPSNGAFDPITWRNGYMQQGDTVTFGFKSFYRPFENPLTVNCYALDGGATSSGETIGMAALIPEPSAFVTIAMGILGVVPMLRRRK